MKQEITYEDYLKLKGIETLKKQYQENLNSVETMMAKILDEPNDEGYYGHVSDFIYDNISIDRFLSRHDIRVVKG